MRIVKLTPTVAVSGQITPAEVAEIAAAGFRVLVNNRPDGEEPGQPASDAIAAAARASGLEYHYLPVNGFNFPGPGMDQMTGLLHDPGRPVLAFCRTGTRCTNLWVASRGEGERAEAAARARELGFDLSMACRS